MKPQLWIIAGPNGAGKSTLADRYLVGRIPVVNPDNIARDTPGLSNVAAGKHSIAERSGLIAAKQSFAWETTLTGHSPLEVMGAAKAAGYKVNLVYISVVGPDTSRLRVKARVDAGGHDIPYVDLARRFERSLKNLPTAIDIADRVFVFDNSGKHRRLVLSLELGINRQVSKDLPQWVKQALPTIIASEGTP